jgi:hypothetical protein
MSVHREVLLSVDTHGHGYPRAWSATELSTAAEN